MALKHRRVHTRVKLGLEEDEITWYSNAGKLGRIREQGLEEDKITWFSTKNDTIQSKKWGLEEDKLHGPPTACPSRATTVVVWKGVK